MPSPRALPSTERVPQCLSAPGQSCRGAGPVDGCGKLRQGSRAGSVARLVRESSRLRTRVHKHVPTHPPTHPPTVPWQRGIRDQPHQQQPGRGPTRLHGAPAAPPPRPPASPGLALPAPISCPAWRWLYTHRRSIGGSGRQHAAIAGQTPAAAAQRQLPSCRHCSSARPRHTPCESAGHHLCCHVAPSKARSTEYNDVKLRGRAAREGWVRVGEQPAPGSQVRSGGSGRAATHSTSVAAALWVLQPRLEHFTAHLTRRHSAGGSTGKGRDWARFLGLVGGC